MLQELNGLQLVFFLIGMVLGLGFVICLAICLYRVGYKKGITGIPMTNGKFIASLIFIPVLPITYLKGAQDYLLYHSQKQKTKTLSENADDNENNNEEQEEQNPYVEK